jgi:site-specific DNA recombinase
MKKAGLYLRVSTKKQDLTSMRNSLLAWANKNGYEYILYEDYAISGIKDKREGINKLMDDARAGKFECVAVIELSRIGRSIGFITSTVKELADIDIPIILTNSNMTLDYRTLEGSATINALAMAADIEYRLILDRNARGREAMKEKGVKVGRKHKEVSHEAIMALQDKGMSLRQIAKELGVSAATIMRRCKSDQLLNVSKNNENHH